MNYLFTYLKVLFNVQWNQTIAQIIFFVYSEVQPSWNSCQAPSRAISILWTLSSLAASQVMGQGSHIFPKISAAALAVGGQWPSSSLSSPLPWPQHLHLSLPPVWSLPVRQRLPRPVLWWTVEAWSWSRSRRRPRRCPVSSLVTRVQVRIFSFFLNKTKQHASSSNTSFLVYCQ